MMFPRTAALESKLKQNEPLVMASYTCRSESECDFSQVIAAISDCKGFKQLQSWGAHGWVKEIVDDIRHHPSDYSAEINDGFLIRKNNQALVHLVRKEADGKKADGTRRTGVIEYNNRMFDDKLV